MDRMAQVLRQATHNNLLPTKSETVVKRCFHLKMESSLAPNSACHTHSILFLHQLENPAALRPSLVIILQLSTAANAKDM